MTIHSGQALSGAASNPAPGPASGPHPSPGPAPAAATASSAADGAADLRRVTVVTPRGRFDLALPATVPLAYLVPTLLRQAGENLAEAGVGHGGWVVQRLGAAPLDTSGTPAALGIADGEVLHLRPARAALPTPVFDDAADAVGTTLAEAAAPWSAGATRLAAIAAAGTAIAVAAASALLAGRPWGPSAVTLGAVAVVLLFAAALVSRAAGDAAAATALGCGAAGLAAIAAGLGILAVPGGAAGPALLAGSATGLLVCAVGAVVVGEGTPEFAGGAVVLLATLGAGLAVPHSSAAGGAAVALAVAFAVTPFIPTFAYRAARLPKPFLPTTAEQLRAADSLTPSEQLAARTLRADRFVTALIGACASVTIGAGVVLGLAAGWAGPVLAGVAAALAALRLRALRGRGQRIWLLATALVPAAAIACGVALHGAGSGSGSGHASWHGAVAAAVAALAAIPIAAAAGGAGPASPPVARTLDIVEALCALAVLPVVLQVLGVYAWIKSLAG